MRTIHLAVLVLMMLAAPAALSGQASAQAERDATAAADRWISLIDAGDFRQSWDEAGAALQGAVAPDQWAATVKRVLDQLGPLQARAHKAATYTTTLPNVPPGEYVVVEYRSEFRNADSAVETVVLQKHAEAGWRVVGFFVRPG